MPCKSLKRVGAPLAGALVHRGAWWFAENKFAAFSVNPNAARFSAWLCFAALNMKGRFSNLTVECSETPSCIQRQVSIKPIRTCLSNEM
jgi:hypothetical protein